jgi:hypothetical protein
MAYLHTKNPIQINMYVSTIRIKNKILGPRLINHPWGISVGPSIGFISELENKSRGSYPSMLPTQLEPIPRPEITSPAL